MARSPKSARVIPPTPAKRKNLRLYSPIARRDKKSVFIFHDSLLTTCARSARNSKKGVLMIAKICNCVYIVYWRGHTLIYI